jgi:hypothetical protein
VKPDSLRYLPFLFALGLALAGCGPTVDKAAVCASTCSGCCDTDGTCLEGTLGSACGSNGYDCNQCSGGQVCSASRCVLPSQLADDGGRHQRRGLHA